MIRELGNVELFELCETTSKVQCSHCLLNRNQGIVYCICGQFLVDSESRIKFNRLRRDALSTWQDRSTKKAPSLAWNAWNGCCQKVDSQGEHVTGIHDRFLRDPVYREPRLEIGWSEQKCKE